MNRLSSRVEVVSTLSLDTGFDSGAAFWLRNSVLSGKDLLLMVDDPSSGLQAFRFGRLDVLQRSFLSVTTTSTVSRRSSCLDLGENKSGLGFGSALFPLLVLSDFGLVDFLSVKFKD